MNDSELTGVIREVLEGEIAAGNQEIRKAWIVQQIVTAHPAEGDHEDFLTACAYHAVSDITGRVIRQFGSNPDPEKRQLVLAGYERVQTHYQIERDGEPRVIAIEALTDEELSSKIAELRSMAVGLTKHADELESYLKSRPSKDTAAE